MPENRNAQRVLEPETIHEIKNHLAVIAGYCELLLTDMPADDPRRADLQEMYQSARALIAIFRKDPPI